MTARLAPARLLLLLALVALVSLSSAVVDVKKAHRAVAAKTESFPETLFLEEKSPIQTKGCDTCEIIDEKESIAGSAIADFDMAQWPRHTARRVRNILKMLDAMNKKKTPFEFHLDRTISEDKRLLDMAAELKTKLMIMLANKGIIVKLPSDNPTLVDAAGGHWEEPDMKDDMDYLMRKFEESVQNDQQALQNEVDRVGIQQYAASPAMEGLINGKNPVKPKLVKKLDNQCACTCPSTSCPCKCEAEVRIGPVKHVVEADVIPDSCSPPSCSF